MSLSLRLAAFYFAFFAYSGAYVAWFPPYLAARGLGAAEMPNVGPTGPAWQTDVHRPGAPGWASHPIVSRWFMA